jgi:type IV secretion system protein VirD4
MTAKQFIKAAAWVSVLSALTGSWWLAVGGIGCAIVARRLLKPAGRSVAYGSAEWAKARNLETNLLGNRGLIVGRINGKLIRIKQEDFTHGVTFGPSGSGKGVGVILPNLLDRNAWMDGSVVVFDPKFENLRISGKRRHQNGQKVVVLDPFGGSGFRGAKSNPLLSIDRNSPRVIEDVSAIAEAIVIKTGHEDNPHWNLRATDIVKAFTTWVVWAAPPHQRNLPTVSALIANRNQYYTSLNEMIACDAYGGKLREMAHQVLTIQNDELGSVLSTTFGHLSFMASPLVSSYLSGVASNAFDPRRLLNERITVYFGIDASLLRPMSRLLRLQLTSILLPFMQHGQKAKNKCLLLLDEAAQLGELPILLDAVSLLRGYSIKVWTILQSVGQLSEMFPEAKSNTFMSNLDVVQYLSPAPGDIETGERLSKNLGNATIQVINPNGSDGETRNYDSAHAGESGSRSRGTGFNSQETGRALLMADEALRMGKERLVVLTKLAPPILAGLVRYYRDPEFQEGYEAKEQKVCKAKRGSMKSVVACALLVAAILWMCGVL